MNDPSDLFQSFISNSTKKTVEVGKLTDSNRQSEKFFHRGEKLPVVQQ